MSAYFINALRNESDIGELSIPGLRFYLNSADGVPASFTYGFYESYGAGLGDIGEGEPHGTFQPFTASMRDTVRQTYAQVMSKVNIHATETNSDDAYLGFGQFDMSTPNVEGYAFYPLTYDGDLQGGSEAWIDTGLTGSQHIKHVIIHEMGHTMGLKHPFVGDTMDLYDQMSTQMSYVTEEKEWGAFSWMDIAALQSIYGPAEQRLGNNTYTLGRDKLIWDGGGVDTLTAAALKERAYIDLNDGSWLWRGATRDEYITSSKQVYLGDLTLIENAVGSRFNDKIVGNELANKLRGLGGNDTFIFRDGASLDGDVITDFRHGDKIDLRRMDVAWSDISFSHGVLTVDDHSMRVRGMTGLDKGDFIL